MPVLVCFSKRRLVVNEAGLALLTPFREGVPGTGLMYLLTTLCHLHCWAFLLRVCVMEPQNITPKSGVKRSLGARGWVPGQKGAWGIALIPLLLGCWLAGWLPLFALLIPAWLSAFASFSSFFPSTCVYHVDWADCSAGNSASDCGASTAGVGSVLCPAGCGDLVGGVARA